MFQNYNARHYGGSILNVGCKEDPARISDCSLDVTNLDFRDKDVFTGTDLTKLKGFVQADFFTYNPNRQFDSVVLGEFLEHCTPETFDLTLNKCYELLKDSGVLILTTPHDPRSKLDQHGKDENSPYYFDVVPGVTSWHQLVITEEYLKDGLAKAGFDVFHYERYWWMRDSDVYWHLVLARKCL